MGTGELSENHVWRMQALSIRGLLIYCSDYKCTHWTAISAINSPTTFACPTSWPRFTCQACSQKGADVRSKFPFGARAAGDGSGNPRDNERVN